ncbi:MAG: hypothetical protein J0M07_18130 [Anaerolineae bacterium]|nr:hypothetical protein [Anaerolineae bacterium]
MMRRLLTLTLLLLAACGPTPGANTTPTAFPFPTMTPGRVLQLPMPTLAGGIPLDGSGLANPATAVAIANRPTATPNLRACPAPNAEAVLDPALPATAARIDDVIALYLNNGGNADNLTVYLRENWNVLGETGFARGNLDLTGEGTPEIVVSYRAPDVGGSLLVFGCIDGRYLTRYEVTTGGDAPQLLTIGDLNYNGQQELVFSGAECAGDACTYTTQILSWNADRGRFVNLVSGALTSDNLPTVEDIDADQINELIVRMDNNGDSTTGPLRTGFTVYDWDGASYVRSFTQLNPPQFRIQVIQQADEQFREGNTSDAIALYNLAVDSPGLENWYPDDGAVLISYARFRLLVAYAFTEDARLPTLYQSILTAAPDPVTASVYDAMSQAFQNAYQVTNNMNAACLEAQAVVAARPEALTLLNRYGSRSPTYAAGDLCPF